MKRTPLSSFLISALFSAGLLSCQSSNHSTNTSNQESTIFSNDSVLYTFVVLGCNRVGKEDTNTAQNPSTANLEQLRRTFSEVAQMQPKPKYLFFAGDMIFGYEPDTNKLARALSAWRKNWEASPAAAAGIELVAIPGNHESENINHLATKSAEDQWFKVMAPYIRNSNGPKAGGADKLLTDQSRLTYSFNYEQTHFVVLNTDPAGQDSHVPANWVAQDIATARAAGAQHIFAIGHKPAYSWNGDPDEELEHANRDVFWTALESNHADAMISAHNHLYRRLRPHGKTSMVIAGNGGSVLEDNIADSERYYGYSVVYIMKSGRAITASYGRDIPSAGYLAPAPKSAYPTTIRDTAVISW